MELRSLRHHAGIRNWDRRCAAAVVTAWALLVLFVGTASLRPWPDVLFAIDFTAFWSGGAMVADGAGSSLLDMGAQRGYQLELRRRLASDEGIRDAPGFIPAVNPPTLLLLFEPLSQLPMAAAFLVWDFLSLLLIVAAAAIQARGAKWGWTAVALAVASPAVADNLLRGQIAALLLLGLSLALWAFSKGHPFLGGLLLGVLWLKPQYVPLFPAVFLVKGRWRELAGLGLAGLAVGAVSMAMVGMQGVHDYLMALREWGRYYPTFLPKIINTQAMVNWRGMLVNLWPGLPENVGYLLVLALGLGTALAALPAWRGSWEPSSPRFARQVLVTVLATLIAIPHSQFHGLVLPLAPLVLACARPMKTSLPTWAWPSLLGVGYLLSLVVWVSDRLAWLAVPYCLLAIALLTHQVAVELSTSRELST